MRVNLSFAPNEVKENLCRLDSLLERRLGHHRDARGGNACPIGVVKAEKPDLVWHAGIEVPHRDVYIW